MEPRIHQLYHKPIYFPAVKNKPGSTGIAEFKDSLAEAQNIKMSKHAKERLVERKISIPGDTWKTINEKVIEARKKGITDSLIITEQAALLVSIKNNTVVTALNRQEASDKIFTNINGTIIIEK